MVRSQVALPEESYLVRIGELAYTVSSMEWTILGDLHRLSSNLSEELSLNRLEPMMTSGIARAVKSAVNTTADSSTKEYLVAVYRALFVAAELRNHVLHARPATHPVQGQRLNRSEILNQQSTGKRFWIDDEWFDNAITTLNEVLSEVHRVRPLLS